MLNPGLGGWFDASAGSARRFAHHMVFPCRAMRPRRHGSGGYGIHTLVIQPRVTVLRVVAAATCGVDFVVFIGYSIAEN